MRRPRHIARLICATVVVVGLALVWFLFAPVSLGGSTSYVVTDGISMQPRFHAGDLVLVRRESSYRVGQIVAYENRELGTIVLHRIVARDGARYVFKGDNNNFIDFEHPARSQLIGALWVHVPGLGGELDSVRSPALIGGLFALGTLLLGGAAFTRRRRRRGRERRGGESRGAAPIDQPRPSRSPGVSLSPATLGLALAAISPFVLLALIAFTRPSAALIATSVPYTQSAGLSYSAGSVPAPAYPTGRLSTGDPVFTHVVHALEVGYSYRFKSEAPARLQGTASLAATVTSTSGWQTTIPLGRPVRFRGTRASVSARLDIGALLALVSRVETVTGVRGSYTLTIVPRVLLSGSLGGAPLQSSFAPESKFSLNSLEIRPVTATGAASEASEQAAAFSKSTTGSATARRSRPAHLAFGAIEIGVSLARTLALGGIALVAIALAAALALLRPRREEETESILARYGSLIVPVERVWQMPGVAVIDVTDIDSLVRIAGHYERSILHERAEYGDAFWVSDESGQFRYAIWAATEEEDQPEQEQELEQVLELEQEQEQEWERAAAGPGVAADLRRSRGGDTLQFGAVSRSAPARN